VRGGWDLPCSQSWSRDHSRTRWDRYSGSPAQDKRSSLNQDGR
jgi:hypothetical protein